VGRGLARLLKKPTAPLRTELLSLPGIGPETADSILLYAAGRPVFVIDAYTRRVLARHGFTRFGLAGQKARYEELQEFFHRSLPPKPELFNEFHAQLVAVGKTFCHKRNPDCARCPLGPELAGGATPGSFVGLEGAWRKSRQEPAFLLAAREKQIPPPPFLEKGRGPFGFAQGKRDDR